jgi:aminodeoxyfutalosine deaminase
VIRYHASWILPIAAPPIRDGWVAVENGRIVATGKGSGALSLGNVAILPGLVNAHTHLELSYLRGEVPAAAAFVDWIRNVMAARRQRPDANAPEIVRAAVGAIAEMDTCGTAVVGDISNTLITLPLIDRSRLAAVVFYELIGFNPADPDAFVAEARRKIAALPANDRVRAALAAHAPYSVAPAVFRALQQVDGRPDAAPSSVHVAESADEVAFLETGGGPWRQILEQVGSWSSVWTAPAASPVKYLDDIGFLTARLLAVHGVQMNGADLARLHARGTTLVACPRSNRYTGAGTPPIADFYASGVRVAVGTDSLASTPDLNLFAELAAMRALAPGVPAAALLESATRHGADALGFGQEYGTIEPGKRARLLAIDLPADPVDVEEYLVSGVHRDAIRWVEE